jgi:hypothetical protein
MSLRCFIVTGGSRFRMHFKGRSSPIKRDDAATGPGFVHGLRSELPASPLFWMQLLPRGNGSGTGNSCNTGLACTDRTGIESYRPNLQLRRIQPRSRICQLHFGNHFTVARWQNVSDSARTSET